MLFKAPLWQRLLVFFVTIPIAVFMNSFRIGVTGVLVSRFGTEQAEGFLHYFEGWIIFASCLLLLFLIMSALTRMSNRRLDDVFDTNIPTIAQFRSLLPTGPVTAPFAACVALLALASVGSVLIEQRVQMIPASASVSAFPLRIGAWQGTSVPLDGATLKELQLTDYFVGGYMSPQYPEAVELYVAYYAAQNRGAIIHSPRGCLPAGGWEIASADIRSIPDLDAEGQALKVNRVVIGKGTDRSLVYYWFAQRGRNLTNEYLVKWFLFWDAVTMNRTDGSLVRLVTPVRDQAEIEAADGRMEEFLRGAYPRLVYQLPQRSAVLTPEPAGR
jgi:exosortase D (VPLPA-CTERM-specific)